LEHPVDHVGDGLEAAVAMPGGRSTPAKAPPNRETFALEPDGAVVTDPIDPGRELPLHRYDGLPDR
jgi:hypothetical protein